MCHAFLNDSRFYQLLYRMDQDLAAQVQAGGCACGGKLHSARYPRKPRGIGGTLDESYQARFSFCCAREGCRRRCTPPSMRFLGRKVYLGAMVILVTALEHGLTPRRRQWLIETLDLWPQTIARWRRWWKEVFPTGRCWQAGRGHFIPPVEESRLPGALLGRFKGNDLEARLCHLLGFLLPETTAWSGYLPGELVPQKM